MVLSLAAAVILQAGHQSLDQELARELTAFELPKAEAALKRGANPNAYVYVPLRRTGLHLAGGSNYLPMVELLLKYKAAANAKDSEGNTPLHTAVWWEDSPGWMDAEEKTATIARLLVEAGADVNATNAKRETPLMWAGKLGHDLAVKELIRLGANVKAKDALGRTALSWSAVNKHTSKTLIKAGAPVGLIEAMLTLKDLKLAKKMAADPKVDPKVPGPWEQTPLHVASELGDPELVEVLLKRGLSPSDRDRQGYTPLMLASGGRMWRSNGGSHGFYKDESDEGRRYQIVQMLLQAGAPVNVPRLEVNRSFSVLYLASKRKYEAIVSLLKKSGASLRDGELLSDSMFSERREPVRLSPLFGEL